MPSQRLMGPPSQPAADLLIPQGGEGAQAAPCHTPPRARTHAHTHIPVPRLLFTNTRPAHPPHSPVSWMYGTIPT